jgi:hypothetical protein
MYASFVKILLIHVPMPSRYSFRRKFTENGCREVLTLIRQLSSPETPLFSSLQALRISWEREDYMPTTPTEDRISRPHLDLFLELLDKGVEVSMATSAVWFWSPKIEPILITMAKKRARLRRLRLFDCPGPHTLSLQDLDRRRQVLENLVSCIVKDANLWRMEDFGWLSSLPQLERLMFYKHEPPLDREHSNPCSYCSGRIIPAAPQSQGFASPRRLRLWVPMQVTCQMLSLITQPSTLNHLDIDISVEELKDNDQEVRPFPLFFQSPTLEQLHLRIHGFSRLHGEFLKTFTHFPSLTILHLDSDRLICATDEVLVEALRECPRLGSLKLSVNAVVCTNPADHPSIASLPGILRRCTMLRNISASLVLGPQKISSSMSWPHQPGGFLSLSYLDLGSSFYSQYDAEDEDARAKDLYAFVISLFPPEAHFTVGWGLNRCRREPESGSDDLHDSTIDNRHERIRSIFRTEMCREARSQIIIPEKVHHL